MNSFRHHKRGAMTEQRVLRIFLEHDGVCHRCKEKIKVGDDYHIDHMIALENGGTDDDDNLAPIHDGCHTAKTSEDHALAGKGRRMAAKHFVPKRYRQKSRWR